ncbi:glycosyltransferase family 4 protein [Lentzea flaviverrucosa]|uniref:Glycosyltransferase involved in cell wall bisynthesis n=1 Tax=Lentzea flaviverrucosa TaxID=200379 RepID=A0A1H9BEA8_9PSEU|nr:glycosyltransferase family 4 protein [Lentzea flaviverrucosa]RDI31806.1 glycosyltransferase involved in cell wall biosynthesis [Lentzea flaviverrucosa]SEP87051.1 Glycosyltransferase involved in cell wall bisynthesis [Lentzea flaviverrucosa]
MDELKIAMVAPPWFEVPPKAYGGIESVCADLADQLTRQAVHVTLIGVGRNGTNTKFVSLSEVPQEKRIGLSMPEVGHAAALPDVLADLDVDLVHDHSLAGPLLARGRALPTVVTAHGPVTGEMGRYYRALGRSVHLVALSEAQRAHAPDLNWVATVHNAVRVAEFPFRQNKEDFALFLGRSSPEKGIPEAIEAARAAGVRLLIAAKCREPDEIRYFDEVVKPMLSQGDGVDWLGEAGRERKLTLLAAARCLLFPIQWEEPFGLVMAEALACGTPVVALRRGSVPEVVKHGETGWVCDDLDELASALTQVGSLSPARCRADAEERFDVPLMARRYEAAYRSVLGRPATNEERGLQLVSTPRRPVPAG